MQLKFTVTGMSCAACSARVEKVTSGIAGVKKAEVNLLAGTMVVETEDPGIRDSIIKAVADAGYQAKDTISKESKKSSVPNRVSE